MLKGLHFIKMMNIYNMHTLLFKDLGLVFFLLNELFYLTEMHWIDKNENKVIYVT